MAWEARGRNDQETDFPNPGKVFGFYYSIKETLNIRIALYKICSKSNYG